MWALTVDAEKLLRATIISGMVMLGALGTGYLAPTRVSTMPEPLALETAPRVRDVRSDGAPDKACINIIWKIGPIKCEDYVPSGYFLVISSDGNAPNCRHTLVSQAFKEVGLCLVCQIWLRNHALGAVEAAVGRDSNGQIGDAGLSKELVGLVLSTELDKDFASSLFFGLVRLSNNTLKKL